MTENKILALFRNTRWVIQADRICQSAQLPTTVRPVPTTISAECGMCLELANEDRQRFMELMTKHAIDIKLYDREI